MPVSIYEADNSANNIDEENLYENMPSEDDLYQNAMGMKHAEAEADYMNIEKITTQKV